jgi:hypothetical protein
MTGELGTDLDQLLAQAARRPQFSFLGRARVRMKLPRLYVRTWSWRRTALAAKVRHDSRVHLIAVGVDGAIFISAYSMHQYDASYAVEVQRAHPGRNGRRYRYCISRALITGA